jgi:hypothetical protein
MTEIFFDGKTIVSKDFRLSELHRGGRAESFKTSGQDMGYDQELKAFIDCASGTAAAAVTLSDLFSTMGVIFAIEQALATGTTVTPNATKALNT